MSDFEDVYKACVKVLSSILFVKPRRWRCCFLVANIVNDESDNPSAYYSQSGAASCDWAFVEVETARNQALIMGKECGCDTDNTMEMIECLRTKDVQDVFDASEVVSMHISICYLT